MDSQIRLAIEKHRITFFEIENGKIQDTVIFKRSAMVKIFKEMKIKMKHIVSTTSTKLYLITKPKML